MGGLAITLVDVTDGCTERRDDAAATGLSGRFGVEACDESGGFVSGGCDDSGLTGWALTEESLLSGRLTGVGVAAVGLISEARDGERVCCGG